MYVFSAAHGFLLEECTFWAADLNASNYDWGVKRNVEVH